MIKNISTLMILVMSLHLSGCDSGTEKRSDTEKSDMVLSKSSPKALSVVTDTTEYAAKVQGYADSVETKLSELSEKKIDVFGSSAEGAQISIYRRRAETLKLKAIYYGETGKNEYEFYFRSKKLVLFSERAVSYKLPIGKKAVRIDKEASKVFVLYGDEVVLGKGGKALVSKDEYMTKSRDIKDLYNEIDLQIRE